MPIKGIIASSVAKVAKFWSYPTTTVTGSRYEAVGSSSTATVLGGRASNGTDNDQFVVSYNKSGDINYQFLLNGSVAGTDTLTGIAIDSSNNVYVGSTGPSSSELFSKFNSAGVQQWAKTTSYSMGPQSLEIDSSGNIYIVGAFSISTTKYQFLMKLSATPTVTWLAAQNYGTNAGRGDTFMGIAIDSGSNVYACGYSTDNTSAYNQAQLYKFNSSGALQWSRSVGLGLGDGSSFFQCDVDSSDNVYAAGFRSDNSVSTLSKFDSAGTLQWTRNANLSGFTGVSVDSAGNSYVVGGNSLLKFNSSGTIQWQRTIKYNTTSNTVLNEVEIDEANGILNVAGYIGGSGGYAFFAAVPADGSGTGTYTLGIYTVNYAAGALTITSPTVTYSTTGFTPFTTAPTLSNVGTTQTTTTYSNNKTLIV